MPAKSESQRKLMGMALNCKRGSKSSCKGSAKKMAKGMTESQLRDFARKKKK